MVFVFRGAQHEWKKIQQFQVLPVRPERSVSEVEG
jgi:hypothetical protein